ncbi:MAG: hypothetical protein AAGD05_05480 [Bacteroidota bacterium]
MNQPEAPLTDFRMHGLIRRLFFGLLLLFVCNKLWIRPWVIEHLPLPFFHTIVYTLPNFVEAVVGTFTITALLFLAKRTWWPTASALGIYTLASSLAAVYVITQELKIHNLGGRNVYDPYDLLASVSGLAFGYWMLLRYGFLAKPTT